MEPSAIQPRVLVQRSRLPPVHSQTGAKGLSPPSQSWGRNRSRRLPGLEVSLPERGKRLLTWKKTPGLSEQNGKGAPKSERKRAPKPSAQPGEGAAEERERKERRESRRLEKGRSQAYPDVSEKREAGPAAEDEKQRKEEEYQTRNTGESGTRVGNPCNNQILNCLPGINSCTDLRYSLAIKAKYREHRLRAPDVQQLLLMYGF
ncbi:hypothetical protein CB1_001499009 [Camelus ferus]|nr:hypothetical protein CB1_001499009 [Camelus ferus]